MRFNVTIINDNNDKRDFLTAYCTIASLYYFLLFIYVCMFFIILDSIFISIIFFSKSIYLFLIVNI